ncbi:MAG: tRNA (adenosine(37)-N6)-threonylcarbamoyltransferase complex ATPase subunit type 1 TsaE [Puniceicoccales bacterium]
MDPIFAELSAGVRTHTAEETETLAGRLATALPPDCTLALEGDLGAGKSTFVRGLARAWGITQPITSPTYTLLNCYQGQRQLLHVDAYRMEDPAEAEALLIEDIARSPFCLAIEWPSRVPPYWLERAFRLDFKISGDAHVVTLMV